jgi:hypothetical protein
MDRFIIKKSEVSYDNHTIYQGMQLIRLFTLN